MLVKVFEELMDSSDPKHHLVLKGLKWSVRIDQIMSEHKHTFIYPPDIAEEFEACCFDYCKMTVMLMSVYHKADTPRAFVQLHNQGTLPHAYRRVCALHEPIFRLVLLRRDFHADLQKVISGSLQRKQCVGGI